MTRELQDNETMETMGQQDKGTKGQWDYGTIKKHNYEKRRTNKYTTITWILVRYLIYSITMGYWSHSFNQSIK